MTRDQRRLRRAATADEGVRQELLLRAFSERYLKRGDWKSRQQLIEHLEASWKEYNELYARPIRWSWTRQKMHRWVARHAR